MSRGLVALTLGFASYGLLRGTTFRKLFTTISGPFPGAASASSSTSSPSPSPSASHPTVGTCPVMGKFLSPNYLEELSNKVLHFWFGHLTPTSFPTKEKQISWYRVDPQFDDTIRREFGADIERAITGHYTSAMANGTPRTRLAFVVMLDQMTRNIYRGTNKMCSGDEQALRMTLTALDHGDELVLHPCEAVILLMPLMHAESIPMQDRLVKELHRYKDVIKNPPPEFGGLVNETLKYAKDHGDVIRRFKRFPSRNAALGRINTPEETEFLKTHKGW